MVDALFQGYPQQVHLYNELGAAERKKKNTFTTDVFNFVRHKNSAFGADRRLGQTVNNELGAVNLRRSVYEPCFQVF